MKWWVFHWIFKKMKLANVCNMHLRRWIFDDFRVRGLGNRPSNSSRNWVYKLWYVSFLPWVSVFTFVRLENWMILKVSSNSLILYFRAFSLYISKFSYGLSLAFFLKNTMIFGVIGGGVKSWDTYFSGRQKYSQIYLCLKLFLLPLQPEKMKGSHVNVRVL